MFSNSPTPTPKIVPFEMMWKNVVDPDRPQMTLWRMPITCWMPKAADTHTGCEILVAFPLHNGCTNAPQCYVHCPSC
jgi:hypothetical protein